MKKQRKHYTPEEKVAILRRHLVEGVPISDLCDERGKIERWHKSQRGVHSARDAAVARRCAAAGGGLRRALQQRSPEQRHWLHHAKGHA